MKDQYFGDRTDYIKHSLLKAIGRGSIELAIHWTRTADDSTSDGNKTGYLAEPSKWRQYDSSVFDSIKRCVANNQRNLKLFEELKNVPNAKFCYDDWTQSSEDRKHSLQRFSANINMNSLFFLDPDNGLEVNSVKRGSKSSDKYVFYDEVAIPWHAGHSLMVYQHYPRVSRVPYLSAKVRQMVARFSEMQVSFIVSTSHAAFLFFPKPRHSDALESVLQEFSIKWRPHITMYRTRGGSVEIDEVVSSSMQLNRAGFAGGS